MNRESAFDCANGGVAARNPQLGFDLPALAARMPVTNLRAFRAPARWRRPEGGSYNCRRVSGAS
ncbi:MAG: hypothetical protein CFE44_15480 [Burkholderiales bacterium PBB4]|nr:MAG: hypothetical protein CFE44_15480 [Burkholderiales bacterium PBB4]